MRENGKKNRPGRLPHFDYGSPGCYFITFCTQNRECCLSSVVRDTAGLCVGRDDLGAPLHAKAVLLTDHGNALDGHDTQFVGYDTSLVGCDTQFVGRGALAPPRVVLKKPGMILERYIQNIPKVYAGVTVHKYVIMPNHVHLLMEIGIEREDGGARAPRPTQQAPNPTQEVSNPTQQVPNPTQEVSNPKQEVHRPTQGVGPTVPMIVGGLKSLTRRAVGRPLWQTSYYDHIIRNEADYLRIWNYIDTNPAKWGEDEYYVP